MRHLREYLPGRGRTPEAGGPRPHRPSTPLRVLHHGDGVLELHLADGNRRNVLGRATIQAIETEAGAPPPGTRVIVLTAEDPDFCAGYDLREAAEGDPESLIAHESNFAALRACPVPVLAALAGHVIGGGLELALAADVRIASPDLALSIPANRLGLVYSEPGVRLLVDELGESMTRAMLLAGKVVDAAEAKGAGLVAEVVERDELRPRVLELAAQIASWPPEATAGNRRVLDVVAGRVTDDVAALRRASFGPGGRLATSIARFAQTAGSRRERVVSRLHLRGGRRRERGHLSAG